MSLRKFLIAASFIALTSAAAPARASADWLFTPFIGATFGGSANIGGEGEAFKDEFERKLNYGASLAWMGGGALGFEFDFGYSPNFFGASTDSDGFDLVGDGNVTTLMGNIVIGAPLGSVRPYASGGIGFLEVESRRRGAVLRADRQHRSRIQRRRGHHGVLQRQRRDPRRPPVLPVDARYGSGRRRSRARAVQVLAGHGRVDAEVLTLRGREGTESVN